MHRPTVHLNTEGCEALSAISQPPGPGRLHLDLPNSSIQPPPPMTSGGALSLQGLIGSLEDHNCTAAMYDNCYTTTCSDNTTCHATSMTYNCVPSTCTASHTIACNVNHPYALLVNTLLQNVPVTTARICI